MTTVMGVVLEEDKITIRWMTINSTALNGLFKVVMYMYVLNVHYVPKERYLAYPSYIDDVLLRPTLLHIPRPRDG